MRCHIYIISPVSSYETALSICIGYFLLARLSGVNFSCAISTHANIASWVNDHKHVLLLVLYADGCCVSMLLFIFSSTLGNAASFIFGYAAAKNIGDRLGGITLGGVLVFMLLVYDVCCIGVSTLGGGLVLFRNGGAGWVILTASFTFYYALNYLLVLRLGSSALVQL